MNHYDYYNREERAICAHLFRLLHEKLDLQKNPFSDFVGLLSKLKLDFRNGKPNFTEKIGLNKNIYCEASIIRDKYHNSKPNVNSFMDKLTELVMKQEKIKKCRLYSDLPYPLNDIRKTHPKQIRYKANAEKIELSRQEMKVYGAMRGIFNAKPDILLTINNVLLVGEIKFTEKFVEEQLQRTWNIAEIWAKLLYKDLGFDEAPAYTVFKLGAANYDPDIDWKQMAEISKKIYPENDRTNIALKSAVELLLRQKLS